MKPAIIKGNIHQDERGIIRYNNDFHLSAIKRVYTIQNTDTDFVRAWQGHKIEQRWFSAITGSFRIKLIQIDDWENLSSYSEPLEFVLESNGLDVLHVPAGYISSINSLEEESIMLVFADYELGEIQDEYRFSKDHFTEK